MSNVKPVMTAPLLTVAAVHYRWSNGYDADRQPAHRPSGRRFGAAHVAAGYVRGVGLRCSQMTVMTVRTASAARAISARVAKLAGLVMVRLPLIAPAAWTAPAASGGADQWPPDGE